MNSRRSTPLNPSPLAGEGQLAQRAGRGGASRNQLLLDRAKWMCANPTDAERRLWTILRDKRLAGYKLRRQQVIEPYIVDYDCFETRTIIEADGSQHADSAYDIKRDGWLTAQGFVVARFWNNDILARTEQVAEAIWQALNRTPPLPAAARLSLSRKGRGFDSGVS